jgi:hypothetical protein
VKTSDRPLYRWRVNLSCRVQEMQEVQKAQRTNLNIPFLHFLHFLHPSKRTSIRGEEEVSWTV